MLPVEPMRREALKIEFEQSDEPLPMERYIRFEEAVCSLLADLILRDLKTGEFGIMRNPKLTRMEECE